MDYTEKVEFIEKLAAERICEDEPERCTQPCVEHPADSTIYLQARETLERLRAAEEESLS